MKYLQIPLREDTDDMPMCPDEIDCPRCGYVAQTLDVGVKQYIDPQNFACFRVKALYECKKCGRYSGFRLGFRKVENTQYVEVQ